MWWLSRGIAEKRMALLPRFLHNLPLDLHLPAADAQRQSVWSVDRLRNEAAQKDDTTEVTQGHEVRPDVTFR
jgi:hypothetical protein